MSRRRIPMMAGGLALAFGLARMAPMRGQVLHASGPLPSFEVATVKPWKPLSSPVASEGSPSAPKVMKLSPLGGGGQTTDRVHFIGQVSLLIASAYHLQIGTEDRMILGAPDWVRRESERYEVQAKIDDSQFAAMRTMAPAEQREQVALMEQRLLAERFGLKLHFETRLMPVYALVVAKEGAKLTHAREGEASRLVSVEKGGVSEMIGEAVTVEQFASSPLLALDGDRVVDQTGLKGAYDFRFEYSPARMAEAGVQMDAPELFPAIREKLGLRLVPSKAQVEVVVVDHVERPSGN